MPSFRTLRSRRPQSAAEVWDHVARIDPRHAAAAAPDAEVEAQKTAQHVAKLAPHVHGRVLDLGCGYGRIAATLLAARPDLDYVGVDASQVMLAAADSELDLHRGRLDALPFAIGSFDSVFSVAVFLHNDRATVRRAISEVHRVLRPGGAFIAVASFPNMATIGGLQNLAQIARFRLAGKGDENGPVRPWSRRRVAGLFSDFSRVEVRPSGFAPVPRSTVLHNARLNAAYRRQVYDRVASWDPPAAVRDVLCAHHDVVAIR